MSGRRREEERWKEQKTEAGGGGGRMNLKHKEGFLQGWFFGVTIFGKEWFDPPRIYFFFNLTASIF